MKRMQQIFSRYLKETKSQLYFFQNMESFIESPQMFWDIVPTVYWYGIFPCSEIEKQIFVIRWVYLCTILDSKYLSILEKLVSTYSHRSITLQIEDIKKFIQQKKKNYERKN